MERFLEHLEHTLHEEHGFSTVGVALALLITLALIFTSAQVYEVNAVSADIQEVADAAALAAENVVGEYCVVVTLCDAVSLSLSLSSLCCLGLGVAAACTPITATFSGSLMNTAQKLREAQRSFTEKAQEALERLKLVLPLAAAAKATSVIKSNSDVRAGASYTGIAILVPWQTDSLDTHVHSKSDEAFEAAESKKDELTNLGKEAEDAAHEANAIKEAAYRYDSGSEDAYCMYERARNLAHLSGADNPYYSSFETWDFEVPLKRAQTYYRTRARIEAPATGSIAEQARSALRKRFYQFASSEVDKGYVHQTSESFDAYFPLLPKNTDEMKQTALYTESRYPISIATSGKQMMHAFYSCPTYAHATKSGRGSIAQADHNNAFEVCPACEFSASSMGSVAAASSSIDNGFEYHYRKVAELAQAYEEQRKDLDNRSRSLKDQAKGIFDAIMSALEEAKGERIKIDPPGKYGAVAFVVTTNPGQSKFISSFVSSTGLLRTRAAMAGATLLPESTESGKTAINSILNGYAEAGLTGGMANSALDLWSGLLKGYGEGQAALSEGLKNAIDAIPFMSESGLGQWAADCFETATDTLGLEPVDLSPQKAVLVNTLHIARADNTSFGVELAEIKQAGLSRNSIGELFSYTLSQAEGAVTGAIDDADFTIEIATIQIVQGAIEIPITVSLPRSIKDAATSWVHDAFASLDQTVASFVYARRWQ